MKKGEVGRRVEAAVVMYIIYEKNKITIVIVIIKKSLYSVMLSL